MAKQSTKSKSKVGRPTEYDPKYCDLLIKHMTDGYSFECFGATIGGVAKSTLQDWEKNNPEFRAAKKVGMAYCQFWWEKAGKEGMYTSKEQGFNQTVWIFNMKNRFNWTDRTDLKVTGDFQEKKQDHDLLRSVDRSELIKLVKKKVG